MKTETIEAETVTETAEAELRMFAYGTGVLPRWIHAQPEEDHVRLTFWGPGAADGRELIVRGDSIEVKTAKGDG